MNFMTNIIRKYETLRGKHVRECEVPFWDAVIVTAADETQKQAFELQIAQKKRLKELPIFDALHVIADPAGEKIGCGGSTLLALKKMSELYGAALYDMRILMIHAGGQSQRLPSHSCLGKLFSLLPLGTSVYQILDLKLALYLPFLERMRPGVFLTASDDIITFDLDQNPSWSFEGNGFTALAHPSPLDVAVTHGVYAMSSDLSECTLVLQKPSLQLLEECGAVFHDPKGCQTAYTDSAYFFDHTITKKFLQLCDEIEPIKCEVDAYGDFLRPLGSNPSKDYLTRNDNLGNVRRKLYDALNGSQLNITILKNSTFYHLGTMREYVLNLTSCADFSQSLELSKRNFSYPSRESEVTKGTIMHSCIDPKSMIGECSVLEYCDFEVPIVFEGGILSNCQLLRSNDTKHVLIRHGTFFYTASIRYNEKDLYVTVAYHLDDDIKKSWDITECGKMKYMDVKLHEIAQFPRQLFKSNAESCSLWNVRLFKPCTTRNDAFRTTLRFVTEPKLSGNSVSAEDVFHLKNVEDILSFHGKLRQKIANLLATTK